MKSTGIVRKLDELGRIVLPIEMRRNLGIAEKDALEIFAEGDKIILKKHNLMCCFCGGTRGCKEYMGRLVCSKCLEKLKNL